MSKSEIACPGCGIDKFSTNYSGDVGVRMKEAKECFNCAFWEIRATKTNPVVIDHYVYSIGTEPKPGRRNSDFLGMAGRRFDIEFFDGRRVTTHNLWGGGLIPERFRDRIPNTARFIGGSREKSGNITCWNPASEKTPPWPAWLEADA